MPSSWPATLGTHSENSRWVAARASSLCTLASTLPHMVKQSLLRGTGFVATSSDHSRWELGRRGGRGAHHTEGWHLSLSHLIS
jgi:hypothetical protein